MCVSDDMTSAAHTGEGDVTPFVTGSENISEVVGPRIVHSSCGEGLL
jgi:hypothetical protein